ncbi:DUF3944 domain-containing protein [Fusobacterium pseudoperiodonticum]|uniref:DUF3944 domain-containing protein n=1 Tax=Fusobacterium pseudoperiodonticum TaxID=2663009 RepID=UPI000C1C6D04|nr:DUF3944 domain-containing protein [Fusobacterium pseudoperiodonticum]ATV69036.1 hypothetical protein CTM92_10880 [Fusobacterium pseudoperiodonticum]
MAYTYDADLEFLGECTDEELKNLAEVLIYDKDGETRFTESITNSDDYKRYGTKYSKYWKVIAGELQEFGGNSFANLFRGNGVKYDEVLSDVLDKIKVSYNKSSHIINKEDALIEKIFSDMLEDMPEEKKMELVKDMDLKVTGFGNQAIMAAVQAGIRAGGFLSYQITVIVANYIARLLLGRGLTLATNAALTKGLSLFIGPIGWVVTGVWTAFDITGPAMRVTLPACVIVAFLRKTTLLETKKNEKKYEEEEKMEEDFIEQEKKFLKELLEKYRIENPKEEINLEEEIKRIDEEMKRMEEEDPSIIERAKEFFENLSFEEDDDENDLESEEVNTEKKERVYTLKNKTKIIHKYEENTVDFDDCEAKLLKIEKYNKDGKIEVECFYHYGLLKKIIYYNEDQTINNIDYFDIYYDNEQSSISDIYLFFLSKMDKYFKIKNLEESDIKIYANTEYGFEFLGNYPSDMVKANKESLTLKILKDDIEIEQEDIEDFINELKSFPTVTEYYSNNKIIKKDIFKVERIMEISDSCIFYANLSLDGVLEKTEKYNDNNEIDEIEEINRHIRVVNADFGDYLPGIKFSN